MQYVSPDSRRIRAAACRVVASSPNSGPVQVEADTVNSTYVDCRTLEIAMFASVSAKQESGTNV